VVIIEKARRGTGYYCSSCEAQVQENTEVCPNCGLVFGGTRYDDPADIPPDEQKIRTMQRRLGSALVVAICVTLLALVVLALRPLCSRGVGDATDALAGNSTMTLSSPAFARGGMIPRRYTLHRDNLSPPLEWTNVPEGARSFALVMRDIDARDERYVHWVLPHIPPEARSLPEGTCGSRPDSMATVERCGYWGPVAPTDFSVHRYVITLYALDNVLPADSGMYTVEQLEQHVSGHMLAKAELLGRFGRTELAYPLLR
jgi:Raf kinase inhibitor-like YbhB/YbcL family protein